MNREYLNQQLIEIVDNITRDNNTPATRVPGLHFYRGHESGRVDDALYDPSICLVCQGGKYVQFGEELLTYDKDSYLIASMDLPTRVELRDVLPSKPYLGIKIDFSSEELSNAVLKLGPKVAGIRSQESVKALKVGYLDEDLQDVVYRLVKLVNSPQDIEVYLPLIKLELILRMMLSDVGHHLLAMVNCNCKEYQLLNAVRWLKQHYAEKITIDKLAQLASMSVSRFHVHFRSLTGISPLQYQKRLRIQEARRMILSEKMDAAEAAFAVGYESPSQFSREYRRTYGAPPIADLRAL